MEIKIELKNNKIWSVDELKNMTYHGIFEIIKWDFRVIWSVVFTRNLIGWIASVKSVKKWFQDNDNYQEVDISNSEIEDMLVEELNEKIVKPEDKEFDMEIESAPYTVEYIKSEMWISDKWIDIIHHAEFEIKQWVLEIYWTVTFTRDPIDWKANVQDTKISEKNKSEIGDLIDGELNKEMHEYIFGYWI